MSKEGKELAARPGAGEGEMGKVLASIPLGKQG